MLTVALAPFARLPKPQTTGLVPVHVPWLGLVLLALTLLALAAATTLASARHAMGRDAVRAVKDDW